MGLYLQQRQQRQSQWLGKVMCVGEGGGDLKVSVCRENEMKAMAEETGQRGTYMDCLMALMAPFPP